MPSSFGQEVTFTATVSVVTPGSGTPTGNVTFAIPDQPDVTVALAAGVASFATSALPAGTHTVTATYAGDANFSGSSGTTDYVVNQAQTTTAVAGTP